LVTFSKRITVVLPPIDSSDALADARRPEMSLSEALVTRHDHLGEPVMWIRAQLL
jgi:hypothetical protein